MHEIIRRSEDCRSRNGAVMNDGIGRISFGLMNRVREALGLQENLCAIQARIGSAKGMWIAAESGLGHDSQDWIEIYPKQEKWACNWADEDHRTLEVKSWATEPKPANLNLQFLPILDDRSTNKDHMRKVISERLINDLHRGVEYLKSALKNPAQLRQWVHTLSSHHSERIRGVPFLAGLPDSDADIVSFLVDGGFDPQRLSYLSRLVFDLERERSEKLRDDLKIRVPKSTRVYMVVDFLGVLQPDEVHICFSKPFGVDGLSDLDKVDVLVARNPAHLPSDIQKVKAIFKPELRHLKDVIVFPLRGEESLASKLSGGDYDGDKAWVCWDPDIVGNFQNTGTEPKDLLPSTDALNSFFDRHTTTLGVLSSGRARESCANELVKEGLSFGLKHSLLGRCTNFKENFCRKRNIIGDKPSILLSWLLGELADEAKKGIVFTELHWDRFRTNMIGQRYPLSYMAVENGYHQSHIIPHLRNIARSTVETTLTELSHSMISPHTVHSFDPDLADYWNQWEEGLVASAGNLVPLSGWITELRQNLTADLEQCATEWSAGMSDMTNYRSTALRVHQRWADIQPRITGDSPRYQNLIFASLHQPRSSGPQISHWELLKASQTFKLYHNSSHKFVWRITGRCLQYIKALRSSTNVPGGLTFGSDPKGVSFGYGSLPVPVVHHIYGTLRPDSKYINYLASGIEIGPDGSKL